MTQQNKISVLVFSLTAFLQPAPILAHPEMVRHGYVRCSTCHVSPSGYGVLNNEGRVQSLEILSRSGKEGEQEFLWGLIGLPDTLQMGGDIRVRAEETTKRSTDTGKEKKGLVYVDEADFEVSFRKGEWQFVGSLGVMEYPGKQELVGRRHYMLYQSYELEELSVRIGRFRHVYGLGLDDVGSYVKSRLAWGKSSESYNSEIAWQGADIEFFATAIFGRPDIKGASEKGASMRAGFYLGEEAKEASRLGFSYYVGGTGPTNRQILGPYAAIAFSEKLYLLSELDLQRSSATRGFVARWGAVNYQKLGYEATQGLHFFVTQEFSRLNFKDSFTRDDRYGLGLQFFPRPHFEVIVKYQKFRLGGERTFSDLAGLELHTYL